MCGIAGRVNAGGQPVSQHAIEAMNRVLAHRGPDGAGVYVKGPVGLGHRRLAILDLSENASQPMANEDGTVHIVFNGEIYNFQELRAGLEARGHVFRSRTDSEVILHLYEEKGAGLVDSLRGMFAFAIWDERKQQLLLARDRVGKKPLYYTLLGDSIVFASEIKAILHNPDVVVKPNLRAIHEYLTYQYVPSPSTAFEGILKLPPAHILLWKEGKAEVRRYWSLSYGKKLLLSEDEAVEQFLALLEESVKLRLVSDVPLGAFLSGGIDSSAVVAMMAKLTNQPVKTFSIGFREQEYNELAYARRVAEHFGTDHHEYIVEPDAVSVLPKLVWHYGEPFSDSSAIPSYYVAQMTRKHVTVALNGDGGDESFAGYERYKANVLALKTQAIPAPLRKLIAAVSCRLPAVRKRGSLVNKLRRFGEYLALTPEYRYGQWMSHFTHEAKMRLYTPAFWDAVGGTEVDALERLLELFAASDGPDIVDRTLDVDVRTYLPDDLLVKVDVACMANSLEGRSPLLDHKLMEFAASLPSNMKLRGGETKYIFKKAMARILPEEILRRPKMGFGVPIDHWFRNQLKEMAYDVLLSDAARSRGYFNMDYVKKLLDSHVAGIANNQFQIWSLLFLELWHQMFIDGTLASDQALTRARTVVSV